MKIETWPITKPIPYARNARMLSPFAVSKVAASIKEFGWKQPIVVDVEGVIIAGHTRLLAAQQLGMEFVPVVVAVDLSPAQAKAYRLADNRVAQETSWDYECLKFEFAELARFDVDVVITGFDSDEIVGLMPSMEDPAVEQEDAEDTDDAEFDEQLVFRIIVECENEDHQAVVIRQAQELGWTCKALMS